MHLKIDIDFVSAFVTRTYLLRRNVCCYAVTRAYNTLNNAYFLLSLNNNIQL